MARIQKDTVNYFPHDSNACSSDTITILQNKFGNDGYAFWFKLLEKLASTEGHYLDVSTPIKWNLLLAKTGTNDITTVEIMKLLVEMKAVDEELWDSRLIWCQKLVDNIADVYKNRRREIPQKPISTNHNGITTVETPITTDESTQSKVNESKVNESKVEKRATPESRKLEFEEYIEEIRQEYTGLNFDNEIKKFHLYWSEGTRKLQRPKLALKNWMDKAQEFKDNGKNQKGKLPTKYTSPEEFREKSQ